MREFLFVRDFIRQQAASTLRSEATVKSKSPGTTRYSSRASGNFLQAASVSSRSWTPCPRSKHQSWDFDEGAGWVACERTIAMAGITHNMGPKQAGMLTALRGGTEVVGVPRELVTTLR